MKKIIVLVLFCLVLFSTGQAQTVYWKLKPKYQELTPFSETLFKAKEYDAMSIINANGEELFRADSITFITNGYALGLKESDGQYLIAHILDANGNVTDVNQEYYVTEYPFFSEDKLAVANKKGKIGFINPSGKQVIPFDYVIAHPFREGYASVSKAKKGVAGFGASIIKKVTGSSKVSTGPSMYIDNKGVAMKLQSEISSPILATSFRNGEALVQCDDDKSFVINRQGKIVRTISELDLKLDDYFSVSDHVPQRANIPYEPMYNSVYSVFNKGNLKGYMQGGSMLCPAQFEEAYGFASGYAVVKKGGKYGLLQLIPGKIDMTINDKGGKLEVQATLPAEFNDRQANLVRTVNDSEKLSFPLDGMQSVRSLNVDLAETKGVKSYDIIVDDLALWRMSEKLDEEKEKDDPKKTKPENRNLVSVRAPSSVRANSKGVCAFDVNVTNRSKKQQIFTVTLSTGESRTLPLGAGKSGSLSFSVSVSKETILRVRAKGSSEGSGGCTTKLIPAIKL